MSAVADCQAGLISPQVAVARLLLAGLDPAAILRTLDESPPGPVIDAMRGLVAARAPALAALANQVAQTMAQHDASGPTPAEGVARIAAFFDGAVSHSPEASVALYSLGDPAILAQATAEIVAWLEAQSLLSRGTDVLDLGCGIGRIAAALAPRCGSVLGLDVSAGMVAEAARRLAPLANVRIARTDGQGLDALPGESFDLVLAVDSFPYIVQTGPATALAHATGAARILRPGGALCILNLSYRGDPAADLSDIDAWAAATGLVTKVRGDRPFRLWDGAAYTFRKAAVPAST